MDASAFLLRTVYITDVAGCKKRVLNYCSAGFNDQGIENGKKLIGTSLANEYYGFCSGE